MKARVVINQKGVQRVQARHPWVFRSDIVEASGAEPGDVVAVFSQKSKFLGMAFYNPRSQITLRFLTHQEEEIDREFFRRRIRQAIAGRSFDNVSLGCNISPLEREDVAPMGGHGGGESGFSPPFEPRDLALPVTRRKDACRMVYGESDLLPSLIVDRYRDVLVFQTLSLGMERFKEDILSLLMEELHPQAIVERNDPPVRELEGLVLQSGVVWGNLPSLEIQEGPCLFEVNPVEGQKTGLFLDQAENHQRASHYSRGRVLDLFCYQGGFALPVSRTADEVIAVDSSGPALEALKRNCARNGITNVHAVEENGFDYLRRCQEEGQRFDTVILDPPPFIRSRKNIDPGLRGYKEINLRAMKLLRPGGALITCSCSQNFSPQLFEEVLKEASRDAKREIQVLEKRGASPDHPVLLSFPESAYLQCWIVRVC